MSTVYKGGGAGAKYLGNAGPNEVLSGKTYHKNTKELLTGAMPNNGAIVHQLPINGVYTIPQGYHNGIGKVSQSVPTKGAQTYIPGTTDQEIAADQYLSGKQIIKGDTDLIPANIKEGVDIFGKVGTFNGLLNAIKGMSTDVPLYSGFKRFDTAGLEGMVTQEATYIMNRYGRDQGSSGSNTGQQVISAIKISGKRYAQLVNIYSGGAGGYLRLWNIDTQTTNETVNLGYRFNQTIGSQGHNFRWDLQYIDGYIYVLNIDSANGLVRWYSFTDPGTGTSPTLVNSGSWALTHYYYITGLQKIDELVDKYVYLATTPSTANAVIVLLTISNGIVTRDNSFVSTTQIHHYTAYTDRPDIQCVRIRTNQYVVIGFNVSNSEVYIPFTVVGDNIVYGTALVVPTNIIPTKALKMWPSVPYKSGLLSYFAYPRNEENAPYTPAKVRARRLIVGSNIISSSTSNDASNLYYSAITEYLESFYNQTLKIQEGVFLTFELDIGASASKTIIAKLYTLGPTDFKSFGNITSPVVVSEASAHYGSGYPNVEISFDGDSYLVVYTRCTQGSGGYFGFIEVTFKLKILAKKTDFPAGCGYIDKVETGAYKLVMPE